MKLRWALNPKSYQSASALFLSASHELHDFQMIRGFHSRFIPTVPLHNLLILLYRHAICGKIEPGKQGLYIQPAGHFPKLPVDCNLDQGVPTSTGRWAMRWETPIRRSECGR